MKLTPRWTEVENTLKIWAWSAVPHLLLLPAEILLFALQHEGSDLPLSQVVRGLHVLVSHQKPLLVKLFQGLAHVVGAAYWVSGGQRRRHLLFGPLAVATARSVSVS
jgi:hypothetical protein